MSANQFTKIKVGVMGYANIAERSLIPAFLNHSSFSLDAVASRDALKAQRAGEKFNCIGIHGYQALLDSDIDLVYIPLPTGLHEEWVTRSLEAGKHVFVEKSFGLNKASTNKMLALAKRLELVAMENFMFPFHSQHHYLMKLLELGRIGSIRNFRSTFCFPPLAHDNFRYQEGLGGGALMDASAYTVKAAQVVLGPELEFLSATMHFDKSLGVDIYGAANFLYKDSIPVNLVWGFDNYYQCGIEILGSSGKIVTKRSFTANIGVEPILQLESQGSVEEIKLPSDNHFSKILDVLSDRILASDYLSGINEIEAQSNLIEQIRLGAKRYEI